MNLDKVASFLNESEANERVSYLDLHAICGRIAMNLRRYKFDDTIDDVTMVCIWT